MKIKQIVFALILCLATAFATVACFDDAGGDQSGSTSGSENESPSVHEHVYTEVGETPSTCVEAGVKSHYKCDECGELFIKDGGEYVETTEVDLALPLAAHSFNGIAVKTNPSKVVYTAFETFDLTGIKVVKTCSVAGCNGEEVAADKVAFAYEKKNADKLTADMTKVVVEAAGFKTDLAITVNKIVVKLPVIESREYTGEAQVAVVPESELYTVTENNGGTVIGKYDVKLTLKDSVNYAFEGVDGAVVTVKFEITKVTNEITMPESIADIECLGEPTIGATAKENATITYVYASDKDGEYGAKPEDGFVAGTYYVKAVAAETDNYKETVSAPMSFNVKHVLESWNTEGTDADVGVCVCGSKIEDVKFSKKVTDETNDVILSAETNAITLGGVSEYKTVKSIKYGDLDLGTDVTALVIPEGMNDAPHGEQILTVVVTDTYDLDHTIEVPVTIVTKSISSYAELVNCVTYKKERVPNPTDEKGNFTGEEDKYNEGKYFILANDITVTGSYSASDIQWAATGRGFAGTLDGRNHSIIGGNMWSGGLFGSIAGGTVKNVKFEKINAVGANRTLIAGTLFDATLENVEIYIVDKKTISGGFFGVLATHPVANVTLNNVKIDATGSTLPYIIGHHSVNADPDRYHFTNVEIIADSVDCFTSGNAGKLYLDEVNGINFKLSGNVDATDKLDPKEFDDSYEYSYVFEGSWARYTELKSVTLNGDDITEYVDLLTNTLVFGSLSDFVTEDMYNTTLSFVVEFDAGEGNSVKVSLNVEVLDENVYVTLTENQDIILKDSTGEHTTFTLNLGEDMQDATIDKVVLNNEELEVADGTVTISDNMKNGTHGSYDLIVLAVKDGTNYKVTVPVTIVTEVIYDWASLLYNCQYNTVNSANGATVFGAGKYYILGQDIEGSSVYSFSYGGSSYTIAWGGYEKGFAGTLDGRGKTIKNVNVNNGGIFSALCGGTVKNVNVTVAEWSDGANSFSLFGSNVKDATFSDITITFNKVINLTKPGVLAGQHMFNTKCTNITIYAYGSELSYLLGTGAHANNANNVCDNVFVYAKSLAKISPSQTTKTGVTFVPDATEAAE